jgi:hypothetical protein
MAQVVCEQMQLTSGYYKANQGILGGGGGGGVGDWGGDEGGGM